MDSGRVFFVNCRAVNKILCVVGVGLMSGSCDHGTGGWKCLEPQDESSLKSYVPPGYALDAPSVGVHSLCRWADLSLISFDP